MKKQHVTLLLLLTVATAMTVGCGTSTTVPKFTKVAFVSQRSVTPPTPLFMSNLDGTDVTPIPVSNNGFSNFPSISADFKTIVYATGGNIWVEVSGGTATQLTTTGQSYFARISPSGKKIVYNQYDSTSNGYHFWILNPDGTGKLDLTATFPAGMTSCYDGSFSADSLQVAFACYGNNMDGLFTIKIDGTGLKTVFTQSGWLDLPSFSPDNTKLVFNGQVIPSASATTYGVGSVKMDGTGVTLLVTNSFDGTVLNANLYYSAYSSSVGHQQIYKANLDGTTPVSVSDGTSNDYLAQTGP